MKKKLLTLAIIQQTDRVLLGMKKRGFGTGRWNGFGGKVGKGETIEEAALRETEEEANIIPTTLKKMGVLEFRWHGKPDILETHIFKASTFTGKPCETEEMRPEWFEIDQIPYNEMWSDDIYWVPMLLAGKKFEGSFLFDENDMVLEHKLKEIQP